MKSRVCLFLVDKHMANPKGGAYALARSHLELLQSVGWSPILIWLLPTNFPGDVPHQIFADAPQEFLLYPEATPRSSRLHQCWHLMVNPTRFLYHSILQDGVLKRLNQIAKSNQASLIWAEHLLPATLAQAANLDLPVIYSHHDWHWRIKTYRRNPTFRSRLYHWASRRHEQSLVRHVDGVVSGSWSELQEIRSLGAKRVGYFPTTYLPVDLPTNPSEIHEPPRIVHLGYMQTTASRIGLQRFLEVAWSRIRQAIKNPNLWVVGSLEGAPEELLQQLSSDPYIHCTGYVDDLSHVLRPYDIHIIPWEHNTGTRTRIPLALNFKQVIVSTVDAAACAPELEHGKNCLLADSIEDMAEKIIALWNDPSTRQRIGEQGRQTFLENFTIDSQRKRFEEFISQIL